MTLVQTALRELMGKIFWDVKVRTGAEANINATATRQLARQGMPHYTYDTEKLYMFNGQMNKRVHGLDMVITNMNTGLPVVNMRNGNIIFRE